MLNAVWIRDREGEPVLINPANVSHVRNQYHRKQADHWLGTIVYMVSGSPVESDMSLDELADLLNDNPARPE